MTYSQPWDSCHLKIYGPYGPAECKFWGPTGIFAGHWPEYLPYFNPWSSGLWVYLRPERVTNKSLHVRLLRFSVWSISTILNLIAAVILIKIRIATFHGLCALKHKQSMQLNCSELWPAVYEWLWCLFYNMLEYNCQNVRNFNYFILHLQLF